MSSRLRFLNPNKTLFLLCDIQEKFRPGMALFDNMVQNASKLTKAGKALEIPLIVTEHYPEKLGRIVPGIDVSHGHVLSKTRFSMLTPEVDNKIKELFNGEYPSNVVLYGLEAHICVEQTAIDLLDRNINVHIVADCSCSRLNQDRDLALRRLGANCVVTTSESLIFNLMREKDHPKFNEVRKYVNTPSVDMQLANYATSAKL